MVRRNESVIRKNYPDGSYSEATILSKEDFGYKIEWQGYTTKGKPNDDPYNGYITNEEYAVLVMRTIIENEFDVPSEMVDRLIELVRDKIESEDSWTNW